MTVNNPGQPLPGSTFAPRDVKEPESIFFYCLIMLFTVAGNLMVFAVIRRILTKKDTNAHNFRLGMSSMYKLVINLTIADLSCGLILMPFSITIGALVNYDVPNWLCVSMCALHRFFLTASVMTLTSIAVNRYIVICKPLWEFHSKTCLISIWIGSGINSLLPIINYYNVQVNQPLTICDSFYEYPGEKEMDFILQVLMYSFSILILLFCYIRLYLHIRKVIKENEAIGVYPSGYVAEKRVSRMFAVCVICFFVQWTPLIAYMVMVDGLQTTPNYELGAFAIWAGYLNSACNPIIYCFSSRRYKREVKGVIRQMFPCCCKKGPPKRRTQFYRDLKALDDFLGGRYEQIYKSQVLQELLVVHDSDEDINLTNEVTNNNHQP